MEVHKDVVLKDFNCVKKYLAKIPFTMNIYHVLLEITVSKISVKGIENIMDKYHKQIENGGQPVSSHLF